MVISGATGSAEIQNAVSRIGSKIWEMGLIQATPEPLERSTNDRYDHDVFISHASGDKGDIVRPLATELSQRRVDVWYDEFDIELGDNLRESIDKGLGNSEYGIVVLSEEFFEKEWAQYELDGLVSRHMEEDKVILPLWYDIDHEYVARQSPPLSDLLAQTIDTDNIPEVADELCTIIQQE